MRMLIARSSPATSYSPSGMTTLNLCWSVVVNSVTLPVPAALGSATMSVLFASAALTFGSVKGRVACAMCIVVFTAPSGTCRGGWNRTLKDPFCTAPSAWLELTNRGTWGIVAPFLP